MKKILSAITHILLFTFSLVFIIPLFIILLNSFKSVPEAASFDLMLPSEWIFRNYVDVFNTVDIYTSAKNGIIYAVSTVMITILLASMCSFVLSRSKKKIFQKMYYIFILGLVMPFSIIPTIWIMKLLHIYGSRIGLILLYSSLNLSFTVFLFTGYIKTIGRELDEASIIDGCGPYRMFFSVIFPLLKPVTITAALMVGVGIWNEFVLQLYFTTNSNMWGMPISIYKFFSLYRRSWNLVSTFIVISTLPVAIVFVIFQKHFVAGMTAGAVKG